MKNCREITELIERGSEERLPLRQRIEVKVHLMMCKLCRNFAKDTAFLDRLLKKIDNFQQTQLTPSEKKQIKREVNHRIPD